MGQVRKNAKKKKVTKKKVTKKSAKKNQAEKRVDPVKIPRSDEEKSSAKHIRETLKAHRKGVENRLTNAARKRGNKPLSETLPGRVPQISEEIQEEMTGEDCCDLLRGIVYNEPDKVIARNYFRVHSGIKESTWNRHYGTFEEFKRQAGIKLSRPIHRLEKQLAKHAAADHYRAMSESREQYEDKYLKPDSDRFQTALVVADIHDVHCDPFALRVLIDTAKRASGIITQVILGGDIFDLPEFGRWTQDPRDWDVVSRIKFVHKEVLKPLREACPDAEFHFTEGNHEARLLRHLADASPAMKAVLADLHGFTIAKLLKLDDYEINYIGRGDLAAASWTKKDHKIEVSKNWYVLHNCFIVHHFPEGMRKNMPGCHGHLHKHKVWPFESPMFGSYEWHQLGCMHVRDASYADGQKWSNGFALVHIDTHKRFSNVEYINITDFCYAGARPYQRNKSEQILKIKSLL